QQTQVVREADRDAERDDRRGAERELDFVRAVSRRRRRFARRRLGHDVVVGLGALGDGGRGRGLVGFRRTCGALVDLREQLAHGRFVRRVLRRGEERAIRRRGLRALPVVAICLRGVEQVDGVVGIGGVRGLERDGGGGVV